MISAQLTPHFTLAEATTTNTGISNIPTSQEHKDRILNTAYNMEIVRAVLGRKPIKINSWYRSPEVNKAVGGVPNSEHALGAAVDFTCIDFGTPYDICRTLIQYSHVLNYNQLIYEGTWVHISFPTDGVKGKNQVLTILGGKTSNGLVQ